MYGNQDKKAIALSKHQSNIEEKKQHLLSIVEENEYPLSRD